MTGPGPGPGPGPGAGGDGDGDGRRRELRGGFGQDAEAYQRTRPVCPAALFDDLVAHAGLRPGGRVVELGCGTGQASVPMAERGLAVTAVELSPELAAVARRRLAPYPAATVATASFEDWRPAADAAPFDAVVAVNALHWIDPELRYAKPAALLAPCGAFAVAACRWARPADAEPFWFDVEEDYRAVGYAGDPPPEPAAIGPWHLPPEAAAHFTETAAERYPFTVRFRTADHLAVLASQSGTRALGAARAAEFLDRVAHRLDALGGDGVTATFVATLTVARRTAGTAPRGTAPR